MIALRDEDSRFENARGLGIRALADAIESEGMEVFWVTHSCGMAVAGLENSYAADK